MKKLLWFTAFLFILNLGLLQPAEKNGWEYLPGAFEDLSKGLNTVNEPTNLDNGECSAVNNYIFDSGGLVKRSGFFLKSTMPGSGDILSRATYIDKNLVCWYVVQRDSTVYKSIDQDTWYQIITGVDTTGPLSYTTYLGDLWFTNQIDGVKSYNGTTVSEYSFIPKSKYIIIYNDNLIVFNMSGDPTKVVMCDYILGPKVESSWSGVYRNFYLGRDNGGEITGAYVWQGILWMTKDSELWSIAGLNETNYIKTHHSGRYGCVSGTTIKEFRNRLVYLSREGVVGFSLSGYDILSENITPTISDLSVISSISRKWTQTSQDDFAAGTGVGIDTTTYPGQIRNSSTTYKVWTSSDDFSLYDTTYTVNADTLTFHNNGILVVDTRLTDDFSSGVISSSWTISGDSVNQDWNADNYYLTLSTSGGTLYNRAGQITFKDSKQYGKWQFDAQTNYDQYASFITFLNETNNNRLNLKHQLFYSGVLGSGDSDISISIAQQPYYISVANKPSGWNNTSPPPASTSTFTIERDYSNNIRVRVNGDLVTWYTPAILDYFKIENPADALASGGVSYTEPITRKFVVEFSKLAAMDTPYFDNFSVYYATYCVFVSTMWDTKNASPSWNKFSSSTALHGVGDIGFQVRVSANQDSWDSYVGVSDGETPTCASKQYIQWKATMTLNSYYEVKSPEIHSVFISVVEASTFTSQGFYTGTALTGWKGFDVDGSTEAIGYSVVFGTSEYNRDNTATYVSIQPGDTIPAASTDTYIKWRSTFTTTIEQYINSVTLNYVEGGISTQLPSAEIIDDQYWLACSSNSLTNDIVYMLDSDGAWTEFSGINASYLYVKDGISYFTSSIDGNVFQFDDINTDSGTVMNAYWVSGLTSLGDDDRDKTLRYTYITGRKAAGDAIDFKYAVEHSTFATKHVSFADNDNQKVDMAGNTTGKRFYFMVETTNTAITQSFTPYFQMQKLR